MNIILPLILFAYCISLVSANNSVAEFFISYYKCTWCKVGTVLFVGLALVLLCIIGFCVLSITKSIRDSREIKQKEEKKKREELELLGTPQQLNQYNNKNKRSKKNKFFGKNSGKYLQQSQPQMAPQITQNVPISPPHLSIVQPMAPMGIPMNMGVPMGMGAPIVDPATGMIIIPSGAPMMMPADPRMSFQPVVMPHPVPQNVIQSKGGKSKK